MKKLLFQGAKTCGKSNTRALHNFAATSFKEKYENYHIRIIGSHFACWLR